MTKTNQSRASRTKPFALGALAGAILLGTGLFLGGAQRSRHGGGQPDAQFGVVRAQKLEIVNGRGQVQLRLRGNHENGGLLEVLDRSGDVRVELLADGSVRTYGGNGRIRALLGRDPHGWGDRRGGVLELFDTNGRHITRLPGTEHPSDCTCDVCAASRPHDHGHDDHDGYDDDNRPRRPGWRWGRDEE